MPTARNTENVVVRESTIDVEMNADGIPSTAPECITTANAWNAAMMLGGRNELVAAGAHSFCCAHACLFCESSHCPPLSALHSTSRRHTEIRFATPPPQSSPHRLSVEVSSSQHLRVTFRRKSRLCCVVLLRPAAFSLQRPSPQHRSKARPKHAQISTSAAHHFRHLFPGRVNLLTSRSPKSQRLLTPLKHQHTNFIMPKEKTTTRGSKKAAGKADGGKKKKDPNMPKRGLSAYMFFANDTRDKVRDENPGIKFGEVGKILGERWKALNEKQKAPYEAKAAADKKRYEEEKAAYTAGGDASEEEEE
ncbi:unnamed protein product [Cercospora beticola]|nr:unnamed protein product [Cercospora beticola]